MYDTILGSQKMKRSEALEEIRKILDMNGKNDGEGELEEAILHHLKSLGMLPPFTYLQKIGTLDTAWEPEDD